MAEHRQDTGGLPTPAPVSSTASGSKTKASSGPADKEGGPAAHRPASLPIVNLVNMRLGFGRMDSVQPIVAATLTIDTLDQVAKITYDQISQLSLTAPPLAQEEFIRVWKTILLYRVQNIQECELIVAPPHRIKLAPSLLLPRPLGDLVYHLGRWQSQTNGIIYDVRAPIKPAEHIPDWWTVIPDLMIKWQTFLSRAANYYMCMEMPRKFAFEGQPLVVIAVKQYANRLVQAKSLTNEPQMSDAIIRLVNEPEMFQGSGITFETNHLIMSQEANLDVLPVKYVASYVTGNQ